MPAGERKIPVPIVEPISTAIALISPRLRGSASPRSASAAGASLFPVAVSTSSAEIIVRSNNRQGRRDVLLAVIDAIAVNLDRPRIERIRRIRADLIRENPPNP